MSDIETEAKQSLSSTIKEGNPISFLPSGLAILAAFALKSAIISDHTYQDRKPFFSVGIRDRFRTRLEIPVGVQMWAASFGGDWLHGVFRSFVFKVGAKSGLLRNIDFFSFTYSAGHLVLQVMAPRWRKDFRKLDRLPILTPDKVWNPVTVRFWPNNGSAVTWDPTRDLSSQSLQIFSNRWNAPIVTQL
ncbi:MAG TPA: hypothetical protein VG206_06420 [Terriglobia bacterium]|nr:hypothetical protein [Terriglobia bacterium]